RLAPNKRPVLLVEALAHLADLEPAVHAVLVGDGSDLYQAEAQRCQDRARELGLRSEEHTSELQSLRHLVCRLLLEKKNKLSYVSRLLSIIASDKCGGAQIRPSYYNVPD